MLCRATASPSVPAAAAIFALLCCFGVTVVRGGNPYSAQTNVDALVGAICEPPFGFLPLPCGDYEELRRVSVPAPVFLYGPNVCHTTRTVRRNTREYRFQRYCDWVYENHYHSWVQRCSLICRPTGVCTERNLTTNISKFDCCDGYRTRPADKNDHFNYYYQTYYLQVPALPVGCPIAEGDSLLDCLIRQNLTSFLNFLEQSDFIELLNMTSPNFTITVFAPTNAAFAAANIPPDMDPNVLVGNHIVVLQAIKESDLVPSRRFTNVANLVLHATTATFPNTAVYNPTYTTQAFINEHFINGARVVNADSCFTVNGTLHIIDRVLMPGNETIAEILSSNPQYSGFRDALEAAGTLQFLMDTDISRTVFVPNNDVFNEAIPEDLLNCLTAYMRVPLQDLVLGHISEKADYNATIALQGYIYSLLQKPVIVSTDEMGEIFLNRDPSVRIVEANIPALNGVIHEINAVLMPAGFTFGKCQEFAPTTAPPTTPPPTTMPMTTMEPETTTMFVNDSMVTDSPAPGNADLGSTPDIEIPSTSDPDSDTIDYEANP